MKSTHRKNSQPPAAAAVDYLVNPAYIVRQMHEQYRDLCGVRGHITSLTPLRPANAPDDWERQALEAFAREATEVSALAKIDGKPYLRLPRGQSGLL